LRAGSAPPEQAVALPESLPLIPVRNALLAAGSTVPLNIGRPTSIAAVEAAERGDGLLAVFAQRDEGNEAPDERDLYAVGCAARLLKVVATPDRGMWIVLRVTEWIRLEALVQRSPFLRARIAAFTVKDENTEAVRRLERNLRERVRGRMATLPDSEWLTAMTDRMTALELADTTIANLRCTVGEKAAYASEASLLARLEYVVALLERVA
jgi:ATP-dependent Lon protease